MVNEAIFGMSGDFFAHSYYKSTIRGFVPVVALYAFHGVALARSESIRMLVGIEQPHLDSL